MDLDYLLKLAGLQSTTNNSCGCGSEMQEAEEESWGNSPEGAHGNPEMFDDGISTLGSTVDTSLRRYLKAKGDHVTVDETVYPDYTVEDVNAAYSAFKEAKDYGPGKIGAIQKMLDKERDAKKEKIDQPAGITLSDWKAIAARKEELMDAGMEPEEAQDQAAEEMGIDPEELVDWLDANDDLYEAEEGTYMKQWYNYSEDYAMLELYVDGELVDKWDGYFGANETGNPLQAKFIEMAKENSVDPIGLKVIDGEDGNEGVFTSSGLKWNSNEAWGKEGENRMFMGAAGQPYADDEEDADWYSDDENPVKDAIIHRLNINYGMADLLKKYGFDRVDAAIEDVADFHRDAEELGSSDISIMVRQVLRNLGMNESKSEIDEIKRLAGL